MDSNLMNIATVTGMYNSLPAVITSLPVQTQLVSGLTVIKEADKEIWADGLLTYTIIVDNNTSKSYSTPIVNDILDPTKVVLIQDSIKVNEVQTGYIYDGVTGLLTVIIPTIPANESSVITFQVEKKLVL